MNDLGTGRRKVLRLILGTASAVVLSCRAGLAAAQAAAGSPRVPYVVVLSPLPPNPAAPDPFVERLRELGLVDGRNIRLEELWPGPGRPTMPQQLDAALARAPAVIVGGTGELSRLALRATQTIPIVMAVSGDPVADGLVASLARPGGNVTGLSLLVPQVNAKRLELLMQVVPGLQRVAVLMDSQAPRAAAEREEYRALARQMRLEVQLLDVSGPEQFEAAFRDARANGAQGLVLPQTPLMNFHRERLASLALENRLPAVGGTGSGQFARSGGLLNYGPSIEASWRRAADYVQRILQGTRPADLPVEQPSRFELVINQRTAQALGLELPQHLLVLADEVIR
jgi:putative ABC transport system substrate-binding protein